MEAKNVLEQVRTLKFEFQALSSKKPNDTLNKFKEAQKQFIVPAPFHLYMSMSTAVNECSSVKTIFELREKYDLHTKAERYISDALNLCASI